MIDFLLGAVFGACVAAGFYRRAPRRAWNRELARAVKRPEAREEIARTLRGETL